MKNTRELLQHLQTLKSRNVKEYRADVDEVLDLAKQITDLQNKINTILKENAALKKQNAELMQQARTNRRIIIDGGDFNDRTK